jgi:hypothetical protein
MYFKLHYDKIKKEIYWDGHLIKKSEFQHIKEEVDKVSKDLWYEEVVKEAEKIGKRYKDG